MGMRLETMRGKIAECYPGKAWQNRVANMSPSQVFAIFKKFEKDGRFKRLKQKPKYKQLTIWDIYPEERKIL